MRTIFLSFLAMTLAACANSDTSGAGSVEFNASWSHTFPPITVRAGTEEDFLCQSWAINNDEPIYVSGVRQYNDGSWHHSNWFHVPEGMFGDDGTWICGDRDWSRVQASIFGGYVFAQSTQTFEEVFRFPESTAVVIPPRSKIVGEIHLVNFGAADVDTTLTVELEAAEPETIDVRLQPLSLSLYSLAIPPQQESRWRMTCPMGDIYESLEGSVGTSDDLAIYYVLGHYHSWGNYFQLSYVDEDGSERLIMETDSTAGDNLGVLVDPPVFANGAPGIKMTCGYNNTTDGTLIFGNDGDKEMCIVAAYVGAPVKTIAWGFDTSEEVGMVDGFRTFEASCPEMLAVPARSDER